VSPVEWSPCRPRTIQLPLTASPCGRLSRPRSTISQSDFHPIISPFSPHRLGRSYKLALEPDGSPLFPLTPLVACWRYEPREHPRPLALARPAIPPSPLSDRVGYSDHVRFRGYLPVHWCSGLQPPCLRFAAAVTGRHARLGTRLLARLYRRRHLRRLSSTRLQGATPQSGRIEARTGLRMMPTSPRSPLSFRTAGFPQYGWKDGVSDGAFPTRRSVQACSRHTLTTYWFASVLRASRRIHECPAQCRVGYAPMHRRGGWVILLPRGPRSSPGCAVPVCHHLIDPIRPTRRHITTSPQGGLYAMPSLCGSA